MSGNLLRFTTIFANSLSVATKILYFVAPLLEFQINVGDTITLLELFNGETNIGIGGPLGVIGLFSFLHELNVNKQIKINSKNLFNYCKPLHIITNHKCLMLK